MQRRIMKGDVRFSVLLTLTVAITFLLAGIVKGVTGMGLPTLAMGLLGTIMPPVTAASLLIVPSFVTNVWQLFAGPSFSAVLRRLWLMMAGILIGTIAGSRLLASDNVKWTTAGLGAALIVYAAYSLLARQPVVPEKSERWSSPAVGFLTGLVTGGTGVFVVPAVPYIQALGLSRDDLIQALGLSFTVSTIALALGLASMASSRRDIWRCPRLPCCRPCSACGWGKSCAGRSARQLFAAGS